MIRPALSVVAALAALPAFASEATLKCSFDRSCDANGACKEAALEIDFIVDEQQFLFFRMIEGERRELDFFLDRKNVSVLERPKSGGLVSTTLSVSGGNAVRSEHIFSGGVLTPMQYHGTCASLF